MNKKSRINFILRTILFFSALIVFIYNPNNLYNILNYNLIFGIKIYHICWLYLINDVLKVIIPCKNKNGTSCDFCSYGSICQFDVSIKGNTYTVLNDKSDEEVIKLMEKEVKK